ncbi:MAG: glutathione S-transferase family protein [Paracoccaceae bacterium]|nr:glutathione S-transferase family protein [Paracoccaceae bacterium]
MYILHYSPDTAALAVRAVLEELNAPYQARLIDREAGALNSPAYRRLHPLGQIPAFETPDGPMFETAAILLWLADRHREAGRALAPAPTAPGRASFLAWLFFTNTNIHTTVMQLFYPERTAGDAAAPAVQAAARARMQTALDLLDQMVARDAPDWLSPDQPSVLGYYIAMLLRWMKSYAPGHPTWFDSADFPALHAIASALERRPAALAAARAEGLGNTIFTNPLPGA